MVEKTDQATNRPTNLKFDSNNMIEKNDLPPASLPPKDTKISLLMEDGFTLVRKTSLERTQSEDKPQFQETLQSGNKGNIDIHHSNIFTPTTAIKEDQPTIQDSAEEIKGFELGGKNIPNLSRDSFEEEKDSQTKQLKERRLKKKVLKMKNKMEDDSFLNCLIKETFKFLTTTLTTPFMAPAGMFWGCLMVFILQISSGTPIRLEYHNPINLPIQL